MGKSKSAKRKRNAQIDLPNKLLKATNDITPPPDGTSIADPKSLHTLISEEELEVTIETLQTLSKYPSVMKSKACKDLRVAVYDFKQACTIGVNTSSETNLTARISAALTDGKYTDALILLAEMRIRDETPKLGALCRWVRDLDVVSGLSMQKDGVSGVSGQRSAEDIELLRVLDAVLRVTGPTDAHTEGIVYAGPIALQSAWSLARSKWNVEATKKLAQGPPVSSTNIKDRFRIVEETAGPLRKPPNHHPAILYTSKPDSVLLSKTAPPTSLEAHAVVPNLSVIKDVLSPSECASIIAATEAVGFTPDAPVREDKEDISVLAHNVYWIVDQKFHDELWERVKAFVPDRVGGKKVRGINRRFRVYRYVPGAEYRCHIDGAWPPSGISTPTPTEKETYIYDSSPPSARQSSLFTFLIYLNSSSESVPPTIPVPDKTSSLPSSTDFSTFTGGETTFFLPSAREGVMNAYPVRPLMGSVAMFPHGEAKGALLHEGTGVRSGAKYIIRTDVVYDCAISEDI